jgi:signal peptidase II
VGRFSGPRLGWGLVTVAVVIADQVTKRLVRSGMPLHESIPVIPGLIHLTHVTNRGALFGMLRDLGDPWRALLFTLVPLGAVGLVVFFQARTPLVDRVAHAGLALILGGAIGNLADRLRFGQVTDFLDVFIGDHHWPAFNVADSAICVGVSLLLLDLLTHGRGRPQAAGAPESHDASRPV